MYTVHTDGGSRGNPGPSGCAFVISKGKELVKTGKFFLGSTTNNQAEYMGALLGLTEAKALGITEIKLVMDSELVIKQIQGLYKVKDAGLKILHAQVKDLIKSFKKFECINVLREKNKYADELANQAMDDEFPIYSLKSVQSNQLGLL